MNSIQGINSAHNAHSSTQAVTAAGNGVGNAGEAAAGSSTGNAVMQVAQTAVNVAQILQSDASEEQKIQGTRDTIALAVADYWTAGCASIFYGWANKQWGGTMQKLRDFDAKYNPMTLILNKLFDSDAWKTEGRRMEKLIESGVDIPESLRLSMELPRGRGTEELIDPTVPSDYVGMNNAGAWTNNQFATGRVESQLLAEDIWGYAAFFEKFGNDWLGKFTETDRREIATKALALGVVEEKKGSINITWSPELEQMAKILLQRRTAID